MVSDWQDTTVGAVLSGIVAGRSPKTDGRPAGQGETGVLKVSALSWGRFLPGENKALPRSFKVPPEATVHAGDLLLSRANTVELVGAVVHVGEDHPHLMLSDKTLRLELRKDLIEPRFLMYALRTAEVRRVFEADATGTSDSMRNLSQEKIRSAPLRLPDLDVQRRIVAKLDTLLAQTRAAREQLEAIPALVEKYRQSVLAAAFRGDLTAEWRKKNPNVEPASKLLERIRAERRRKWEEAELAKMKAKGKVPKDDKWKAKYVEPEPVDASGLPELPATWLWVSVADVGNVETGFTPPTKDAANFGQYLAFFKPTDLDQGYRVTQAREHLSKQGVALGRELPAGSVLVTCIGATIGKTGLARVRCATNQQINAVVPAPGVGGEWLYWVLASPQGQDRIVSNASATTLPIINKSRFESLAIPLVPVAEQVEISRRAASLVAQAESVTNGIELRQLDVMERALLAKAFSGELVLPGPPDEPANGILDGLKPEQSNAAEAPQRMRPETRGPRPMMTDTDK